MKGLLSIIKITHGTYILHFELLSIFENHRLLCHQPKNVLLKTNLHLITIDILSYELPNFYEMVNI